MFPLITKEEKKNKKNTANDCYNKNKTNQDIIFLCQHASLFDSWLNH